MSGRLLLLSVDQMDALSRCLSALLACGWCPDMAACLGARRVVEALSEALNFPGHQWSPVVLESVACAVAWLADSPPRRTAGMLAGALDAALTLIKNYRRCVC